MSPLNITLKQLLDALQDPDKTLNPRYLYRLSDLEPEESKELEQCWPRVPTWRRQAVMEDILQLTESDPVLSFEAVCRIGIQDADPRVRELAVQTLWEYDAVDLIPAFLLMVVEDVNVNVRMASAIALGSFVYLGELEEIREATLREVEDRLLEVVNGKDDVLVRRVALESLGYSSRGEVPRLIEKAYYSGNEDWLGSALLAMGRSANRKWAPKIVEMLKSDSANVRAEAASALGELEIKKTAPDLLPLIQDDDDEVRMAAIWSLSKIGGEGVREVLEELYETTEDEEEADFIASAMENLVFADETGLLALFDFMEDDEEDSDLDALPDDEDMDD